MVELKTEGVPRRKYWATFPPRPFFFFSWIPNFQARNGPRGVSTWGSRSKSQIYDLLYSKDCCPAMKANRAGWGVFKWLLNTDVAPLFSFWVGLVWVFFLNTSCIFFPFVLNFKIQRGNEWNVCFAVCVPQYMSFHQNPQVFSGRVISRHSGKQLTLSGLINAFCPCLFVMWTVQTLFSGFLVKLGLLIPESQNWLGKVSSENDLALSSGAKTFC